MFNLIEYHLNHSRRIRLLNMASPIAWPTEQSRFPLHSEGFSSAEVWQAVALYSHALSHCDLSLSALSPFNLYRAFGSGCYAKFAVPELYKLSQITTTSHENGTPS
jgi:hypothetical protein